MPLNTATSALLIMDYQNGILANLPDANPLLANAQKVLGAARAKGLRIIYIGVEFREGYPEVSPDNKVFDQIRHANRLQIGSESAAIHADVAPQPGELHLSKHRFSAFAGNALEIILRAQGIENLVLMGVSTSGVVLSTLRYAFDQDFKCTVLADSCADPDSEVHRVLTEKVFPKQAEVISTAEFITRL